MLKGNGPGGAWQQPASAGGAGENGANAAGNGLRGATSQGMTGGPARGLRGDFAGTGGGPQTMMVSSLPGPTETISSGTFASSAMRST